MNLIFQYLSKVFIAAVLIQSTTASAQNIPANAQGLKEELISVDLMDGKKQAGVYSTKLGSEKPTRLAVLLPGYPSGVRPVVEAGIMTSSRLNGNFLIRSRGFLVDENIASLIVDCQSESGDYCSSSYQASKQRQMDVDKLIAEVRARNSSITEIWLVGTSMGTVSSSFMPVHNPTGYAGAIHTASITEPYARNSYRELGGFDYKKATTPQFFVHHAADPCYLTTYTGAKSITDKYKLPLVTVTGGSNFQGNPCNAFTEHGFRGKEKEVMTAIGEIIKTGSATQLDLN
jgi:hypothetical protein